MAGNASKNNTSAAWQKALDGEIDVRRFSLMIFLDVRFTQS